VGARPGVTSRGVTLSTSATYPTKAEAGFSRPETDWAPTRAQSAGERRPARLTGKLTKPGTGDPPLLERERELAELEGLLEGARAGSGAVTVIDGEAGVGKSRLVRAACESAAAAGMRVSSAHGSELERHFAWGVARQLLGKRAELRTGDMLATILALHEAVLALSQESPVLLAIDDAQLADEPSLRFLAHLSLRIRDLPVAMITAVRSGAPNGSEEIVQSLRESPSAHVISPSLLSEAAVATLVGDALGKEGDDQLPAACLRATGGNPFYLIELLRALATDAVQPHPERIGDVAPPAVLRSVVIRLARLGEDASALARAAAVLGDEAPLDLSAELAGLREPAAELAADVLAKGGILQPGEPLRFLHPLIASAVEADMGGFERTRVHRRAAMLLRARGAPAERVAAHLMVARPAGDEQVVEVLKEAAAGAVASGAPAAAARFLGRALEEPPAPQQEPEVLLASARAELLAGSRAAAARLEEALKKVGQDRHAEVLAEAASLAHLGWDLARAVELAARARGELAADDPRQEKLLGIELGAAALHPDLVGGIQSRLEPLLERARREDPPSDPRLLALLIGQLGIEDPPALVRGLVENLIAVDPLIDDSHGTSVGWVAAALEWVDELELAERWLDEAVANAARRGAVLAGSTALINRARVRLFSGRLQDAVEDGERGLEIYRYGWTSSPWSTPGLAMTHIALGDLSAAREAIQVGHRAGAAPPDHGRVLEAEARLHLAEGDPTQALHSAQLAGEFIDTLVPRPMPRVWEWRRLAASAAHRLGRDERAWELLEPDLKALRAIGPARQLGQALTVAGQIAGDREGLELLAEAVAVLERSPARLQRAETSLELGRALRRAGRRTAAKEPLYRALELAAEMGAAPLEHEARGELGRLGLRPRRTAQTGVASLTPSEQQVSRLAADGLTTPQIAARLYISRNTVETHLRHVYQKLGLSGRAELREALDLSAPDGEPATAEPA
jgi:DNA-binding CsgD family transcriptional regulator